MEETNDKETEYVCNIKASPYDERDFEYIGTDVIIPDIIDYRNELKAVRDQGKQGTCFAQSAACMKEWQEKRNNGFSDYFSPQFLYNNRSNKYDNNKNNDNGMYGRNVMKLLKERWTIKKMKIIKLIIEFKN